MNDPYVTHDDVVQLIDWIDGITDLALSVYAVAPSEKLERLRAALEKARDTGGDVYLIADGKPC